MRFLGQNLLGSYNNQSSITVTSGDQYQAFSDTAKFNYESVGQATDGDTVIFQENYSQEQTIDTIFVLNHNFVDFSIFTASGAAFTDVTSLATLTDSADGLNKLYKFATPISFTEIKFEIDDTSPANSEKSVGAILGMLEIGAIERFKGLKTKGIIQRKTLKLESGGVAVLNKGDQHWDFSIDTDLVSIQDEIDTVDLIQNRTSDFFFWINDNNEGSEKVKQEPYRFQDVVRCAYTGGNDPKFYKNYFNKTISNKVRFAQTAKINYFDPTA